MTDFEPDTGPPPRSIQPWTKVQGHVVTSSPPFICKCGWRAPRDASRGSVDEHLQEAWPLLVERMDADTFDTYRARLEQAHAAAVEDVRRLEDAEDLRPIPPGGEYPIVSQELGEAEDRLAVLQHQLTDVNRRWPPSM